MKSDQYEELCRLFLANQLGVPIDTIKSGSIPNPRRPGLPEFEHQIDLHWETQNELSRYEHIANAKWRSNDKVDQPEVLLLQQVKHDVGAHKAFMITSTGFTAGAVAAAKHHGIALHVLVPATSLAALPTANRVEIQRALAQASSRKPPYIHTVVHRALADPTMQAQVSTSAPTSVPVATTRVVSGSNITTRAVSAQVNRGGAPTSGTRATGSGSLTRGGGGKGQAR